jgi:hypothetical protein
VWRQDFEFNFEVQNLDGIVMTMMTRTVKKNMKLQETAHVFVVLPRMMAVDRFPRGACIVSK